MPLKVCTFNARCLSSKFSLLSDFLTDNDPDVLVITETWFDEGVLDSEFTDDNYCTFRKDRKLTFYSPGTYKVESRGGVLLMIKKYLLPVPYTPGDVDAEILWVQITPRPNIKLLIGGCYRPEEDEENILNKITQSINAINNENCILLGDFNFRNIDWSQGTGTNERERLFIDAINDNLLSQIVTEPTRGNNILDLAFVGDQSAVTKVEVGEPFSTSDHKSVHINLECQLPRINMAPRKVYLYSKANYTELNKAVQEIDWDAEYDGKSTDACWSIFLSHYKSLVDRFIPHKMVKPGSQNKPPWTRYKTVLKAKKMKRKKWVRYKKSGLESDKILYEKEVSLMEDTIRKAKSHYEDKLVSQISKDPKRFWNYTKHFSKSSSTIEILEHDGNKICNDTAKAEILNNFFISVLTREKAPDFPLPNSPNPENILLDFHITPDMVRAKLAKLKRNKAPGPDGVSINVLRSCLNFDLPLAFLFNRSIQSGKVPQDWRDANVTPLFKKGNRTSPNNYRPVSLTSQVVKILERLFQDEILSVMYANKTIHCDQHGFQEKCSCITQLLECFNDWTDSLDNKKGTDVIYLDFSKAFDTVPHQRLIHKLKSAGIRNKCLMWINNFLSDRRQRVIMRNGASTWLPITSGVPQGSILGPILFLIYVNDLPDVVKTKAKMFADDTKLYNEISSISDCMNLQDDLNSLAVWSQKWLLNFNESKCTVLRIKSSLDYIYTLNGSILQETSSQKDLGVIVSNSLHPREHIQSIVKKANQRTGLIRRCFTSFSERKTCTLYKSIIRPVLEYGSPVWSPWHKKDITELDKAQDRCLRLCNHKISLPSLEERRLITDLCKIYKYTHDLYKTPAESFFKFPQRQLRGHTLKLAKNYARTDVRKHFFSNRSIDHWNSLPEEVVSAESLNQFKTRLMRSLPMD